MPPTHTPKRVRSQERERARSPAPFLTRSVPAELTAADLDVTGRARLVVSRGARDGVADAVATEGGDRDLDVLDPGVVRLLQLRQRDARVAGGVVGVERLHAGNGCPDVRLRCGLVRPRAEAEVRGDRNGKQDPEDDDHDKKLEQGEATLTAVHLAESVRKP